VEDEDASDITIAAKIKAEPELVWRLEK